jgi:hypothetical protein
MPRGIPVERVVALERDTKLQLTREDHEAAAGFLHFCDEWDFMLIDKDDPEFDCCICIFSSDYDPITGKLA